MCGSFLHCFLKKKNLEMWTGILTFMVAVMVNTYGRNHIDKTVITFTDHQKQQYAAPLYDWFHTTFPDMRRYRWISDLIDTGFLLAGLFFPFFLSSSQNYEFNFLAVVTSLLYIIRIFCCSLTIIPKCRIYSTYDHYTPVFQSPYINFIHKIWFSIINGLNGHDLIFSGHCTMVICFLCHWTYFEIITSFYKLAFLWSLAIFMSFWIVISRCHYSVCVVVAWCVTISFYITCVVIHLKLHPRFFDWYFFDHPQSF
jgi:PAP2 superfamily C-terminal